MNKKIKIMEVCGTHTSVICKYGIKDLVGENIQLVSGPGCPVCVTKTGYIDKLIEIENEYKILTFGDMVKVRGSNGNIKNYKILYNPLESITIAENNPLQKYVFACVGFETTLPIYALLMDKIIEKNVKNLKLITSLKAIIPAVSFICENEKNIDAFIAPGHVCVIIGAEPFKILAQKYKKPIIVTGFTPKQLILSVNFLKDMVLKFHKGGQESRGGDTTPIFKNLYKSAVTNKGNTKALEKIDKYFRLGDDYWRGIGKICNSAYFLKEEYKDFEIEYSDVEEKNVKGCRCSDVIMGRIIPTECPLFGKICTPLNAIGSCMVSSEGACSIYYE
jgi:hydrogenase expression/formation protein HypD